MERKKAKDSAERERERKNVIEWDNGKNRTEERERGTKVTIVTSTG